MGFAWELIALVIRLFGIELNFKFEFFMLMSVLLIADRTNLLAMMLLFILLHEIGHLIGFMICKIRIKEISLELFGIRIKREARERGIGREIFVYLAGALMNMAIAFLVLIFGGNSMTAQVAVGVNLMMAIFNLLPIGNLDGGNILRLLLTKYTSIERFEWIFKMLSIAMLVPIFIFSVYLIFSENRNPTLFITCLYLFYSLIST